MGRKTVTYDVDTRNETNFRFEQQQKNLQGQLGGVIFMCNNRTYQTCMEAGMFGLPSAHWCYISWVRAGMPLFLYNFDSKQLHGIFKAASDGDWEIDPHCWTDGTRRTPYPCQVAIETYLDCPPIPLDQLRPILAENYIGNTDKFQQELSKKQATELCALFRRKWEGQRGNCSAAATASLAALDSWPGLASGSGGAGAGGNQWSGGRSGGNNGAGVTAMESEPAGPPSMGGKTYAQMQEEEARRAARAAKAAAKQTAAAAVPRPMNASGPGAGSSGGAGTSAATAAAANRMLQQQQQQQQVPRAVAALSTLPQLPPPPQQQHQLAVVAAGQQRQQPAAGNGSAASAATAAAAAGAGGSSSAAGVSASRSGVDDLSAELTALKTTLKPLIHNMIEPKMDAELRVAGSLQAHLARLDDSLMKVQKERGKAMAETQKLAGQVQQLQQENTALRQALSGGGPADAAAAAAVPQAGAAPAPAAKAAAAVGRAQGGDEIFLLGGNSQVNAAAADDGGWLNSVMCYSPSLGTWRQGPDMPIMRGYGCSSVLGGHLYVMGGGNSHEWLGDCQRLDLRTQQWEAAPSMSTLRGCAGAAALGPRLYVVGGGMADVQYDTVEIYNPEIDAWMPGPKLRAKRFSTAASTLDGCVYVTGGYDGSYLQSAERLDPREGKWQMIADMHDKRGAHACTAGPSGLLYVLGGYDVTRDNSFMAMVEAFDPRTGTWSPKGPMQAGRAYGAAAHADGALWVLGGMLGEQYNELFERYSEQTGAWETVPLPSNVSTVRAFLTASVVPAGTV